MKQEMIDMALETIDLLRRVNSRESTLDKELSKYDKLVSTYEHLIECGQFPANVRATIYKEMDELLDKRRLVKLELAQIRSMSSALAQRKVPIMDNIKKAGTFTFTAEGMETEFTKYMKYIKPEFKVVKGNGKKEESKK